MAITYEVGGYAAEDKSVEVVFTNDEGLVHKRQVNLPKEESGAVDQDAFNEILEGQLRGVENKASLGVITFVDPNAETEGVSPGEAAEADPAPAE